MRSLLFFLTLCSLAACQSRMVVHHVPPRPLARWEEPPPPPTEIDRIRAERGDGWGMTVGYQVDLQRSGASSYEGRYGTPRQGRYVTVVDSASFDALAEQLVASEFFRFDPRVTRVGCEDASRVEVIVTLRSGQLHSVRDPCGGDELKAVALLIEVMTDTLVWLSLP